MEVKNKRTKTIVSNTAAAVEVGGGLPGVTPADAGKLAIVDASGNWVARAYEQTTAYDSNAVTDVNMTFDGYKVMCATFSFTSTGANNYYIEPPRAVRNIIKIEKVIKDSTGNYDSFNNNGNHIEGNAYTEISIAADGRIKCYAGSGTDTYSFIIYVYFTV